MPSQSNYASARTLCSDMMRMHRQVYEVYSINGIDLADTLRKCGMVATTTAKCSEIVRESLAGQVESQYSCRTVWHITMAHPSQLYTQIVLRLASSHAFEALSKLLRQPNSSPSSPAHRIDDRTPHLCLSVMLEVI